MVKQKVVIIHNSAIIQKGLADILLHTCNIPVSQIISDYSDVKSAFRLKKCILLIDSELVIHNLKQLTELKQKGNSVYLIADNSVSTIPEVPNEDIIFINDNLTAIQKKLNSFFPSLPQKTVEPDELTYRETEVLKLVAQGNSNKEIADYLSISIHTVISHRKNICRKLEIKTISGLTLYALINNLIN